MSKLNRPQPSQHRENTPFNDCGEIQIHFRMRCLTFSSVTSVKLTTPPLPIVLKILINLIFLLNIEKLGILDVVKQNFNRIEESKSFFGYRSRGNEVTSYFFDTSCRNIVSCLWRKDLVICEKNWQDFLLQFLYVYESLRCEMQNIQFHFFQENFFIFFGQYRERPNFPINFFFNF